MGGGLMQLVAYGAQDIYLTGNPQITFFKVVYRRHTNFSMESIVQTFSGTAGYGSDVVATISRNGDLVGRMYVEYSPADILNEKTGSAAVGNQGANIGNTLIKECEIEIGGQRIDRHYSHWLTTYNELTEFNPAGAKAPVVTGNSGDEPAGGTLAQRMSYNHIGLDHVSNNLAGDSTCGIAFVPLQFWFCRNPGLALPLIALQYHEVKVKITICGVAEFIEVTTDMDSSFSNFKLWCDYIYLDTDERRRFAQVSHEYLIEQLQFMTQSSEDATTTELNFNHPVKELIFTGVPESTITASNSIRTSGGTPGFLVDGTTYQLKLNGHDRFKERDKKYFTRTQIWQHHTGYGGTTMPDSIGVYSFALKPEEHQPSGTCNFSRIDNAQLVHPAQPADTSGESQRAAGGLNIYAVNYNVLRIMSGMGGLAYSN
jgi:hypothetical protein